MTGHVFSCQVHDVMHDFIILKSTEENFVTLFNDMESTKGHLDVRRLSLQIRNSEGSKQGLGEMVLNQARSLNFWGPAKCLPSLAKFLLLRVVYLDVYDYRDEQCDLSSIGNFFQLRYLRIRGIGCKELRQQLHKLQHLKTLEIVPKTAMVIDVGDLPLELWHLVVPSKVKLIGGINRMTALRTMKELILDLKDMESTIKGLDQLVNLRELTLSLSGYAKRGNNVGDFLVSSLCRLSSLHSLVICGGSGASVDVNALNRWHQPPCHLRRLHARPCPFSTVPEDWITQLRNLRSLEIKVVSLTRSCAKVLASLTMLVYLRLHVDEDVPEEGVIIDSAEFPDLKEFWFAYQVPCLVFKEGTMPKLQTLTIQCYANSLRQTDDVLHGIEHLGLLKSCKVDIFDYMYHLQSYTEDKAPDHVSRWDKQLLVAAFRKAMNKHPCSLDTRIRAVYRGTTGFEKDSHYHNF